MGVVMHKLVMLALATHRIFVHGVLIRSRCLTRTTLLWFLFSHVCVCVCVRARARARARVRARARARARARVRVRVYVRAFVRARVRACVRACVRVCVCYIIFIFEFTIVKTITIFRYARIRTSYCNMG